MKKNPFIVRMETGKTYSVLDVHGMIARPGVYEGVIEDQNMTTDDEHSLLLFRLDHNVSGVTRWAGAVAKTEIEDDEIHIILVAYYYGDSPETLVRWNHTLHEEPNWVRSE